MTADGSRRLAEVEVRKRLREAFKPSFFQWWAVAYLGICPALLGILGRAWPAWLLIAALTVGAALTTAARLPDWWQIPWLKLWYWVATEQRRRTTEALGVRLPSPLTSVWLDARPAGTVPDRIRAGVLATEGRLDEARVVAQRLPADAPLDRLRRAVAIANLDLMAGLEPDYSAARRELPALDGDQRRWAEDTLAYNEFVAAVRAGRSIRGLPRPDTRHMRLGIRARLRLLRFAVYPLPRFALVFVVTYLALSILSFLVGTGR
jgi:hypothetical protein